MYKRSLIGLIFLFPSMLYGQGKISGLAFGDFYYIVSHHNRSLQDQNGFWYRRIYFTYDRDLGEHFSTRLRLEMNHPGNFTAGDAVPYVKDAYLQWKLHPQHTVILGILPAPMFEQVEAAWGYRSIEKTPGDLYKLGSTREVGVAAQGSLTGDGLVRYHAAFGNGEGLRSEGYRGKKLAWALQAMPASWILELYGDYARTRRGEQATTWHGLVAYKTTSFRIGTIYEVQNVSVDRSGDYTLRYLSIFGAGRLDARVQLLGRVDRMLEPNPRVGNNTYLPLATTSKATLWISGVDIGMTPQVRFQPNVEVVTYDEEGLDADVFLRWTFLVTF